MGYYVDTLSCQIGIPLDKVEEAYRLVCGSERFSWLGERSEGFLDALDLVLGDEVMVETWDDTLQIVSIRGKSRDEGEFLDTVAPLVTEGSWVAWHGEDGEIWRGVFREGRYVCEDIDLAPSF